MKKQMDIAEQQAKLGRTTIIITLLCDTLLSVLKIITGWLTFSQALIADGFHSLSDAASDLLVLIAFILGRKPVDQEHPYGHGKIETLLSWSLGAFLVILAFIISYKSIDLIDKPHHIKGLGAMPMAALSFILKEWLYRYNLKISKKTRSSSLEANALHHRSDALSSIAVFIGIALSYFGYQIFDLLASIGVAIMIGFMGFKIMYSASQELIETSLDKNTLDMITKTALEVPEVYSCHQIHARKVGNNIVIELHIVVDPKETVLSAHNTSNKVEDNIRNSFPYATNITVHIDPYNDEKEKR